MIQLLLLHFYLITNIKKEKEKTCVFVNVEHSEKGVEGEDLNFMEKKKYT